MNRKDSSYVNPAYIHDEGATPELRRPSNCQGSRAKNLTFREKIMQQKVEAWKPVYEPISMIAFLFIISVIFVFLGFIMMGEIKRLLNIEKKYTCNVIEDPLNNGSMIKCNLNVSEDIYGTVVFMYRLTNFYQNNRLYQSTNYYQALLLAENCKGEPLVSYEKNLLVEEFEKRIPMLPKVNKRCGAGDDFMYQDTFELLNSSGKVVPMTDEGIVHDQDRKYFKNPKVLKNERNLSKWDYYFERCNLITSKCWKPPIYELDLNNFSNNALQNADYLVWRKRAAFPTFIKTYRKLKKTGIYKHGLPAGKYTVTGKIKTTFKEEENIKRQFFITTTSWLGIRNLWFAKLYVGVGITGIITTVLLIFTHIKFGKTLDQKCNDSMPIVFHG